MRYKAGDLGARVATRGEWKVASVVTGHGRGLCSLDKMFGMWDVGRREGGDTVPL